MDGKVKLTEAQRRCLRDLDGHQGSFACGYGRSAHALARMGLAKRKYVPGASRTYVTKFAISSAGRAHRASGKGE